MVFELTGSYAMLAPSLLVCSLCFLSMRRWTLYQEQVASRLDSPAHRGEFIIDVLAGYRVGDVFEPQRELRSVPLSMPLAKILELLPETDQSYFPVIDKTGRMAGVFSANDVRRHLYDKTIWDVAVAADLMVASFLRVTPQDDLNTALRRFTMRNIDELPVVAIDDDRHLLGMLRRKELIAFYNQRFVALHGQQDACG
jgi:CIC family chloride channel protein